MRPLVLASHLGGVLKRKFVPPPLRQALSMATGDPRDPSSEQRRVSQPRQRPKRDDKCVLSRILGSMMVANDFVSHRFYDAFIRPTSLAKAARSPVDGCTHKFGVRFRYHCLLDPMNRRIRIRLRI